MTTKREFLKTVAAGATVLGAPAIVRAQKLEEVNYLLPAPPCERMAYACGQTSSSA
jgi:hypothetical protein